MMMKHPDRKFELYWDPAQDLSINEQRIRFQGRHKDNFCITFKGIGDGLQIDYVCNCGYMYSITYCKDELPDSKHYLFETRERFIWI